MQFFTVAVALFAAAVSAHDVVGMLFPHTLHG
jgi:hypothetical protein